MADDQKKSGNVYIAWGTFKNCLDQLSQAVPLNTIDRTVFPGLAWAVQNQLFTSLRWLGLINAESRPTNELVDLVVSDESQRRKKLGEILREKYSDLFALDLKKTTPGELLKEIEQKYGISGDTRDKAYRFFVSAAQYSGIEMSPLIGKRLATGATTPRRRRQRQTSGGASQFSQAGNNVGNGIANDLPNGTARTIGLRSGGSLTLTATLDLFALSGGDRKFVFELIDKLEEYEQLSAQAETPASGGNAKRA